MRPIKPIVLIYRNPDAGTGSRLRPCPDIGGVGAGHAPQIPHKRIIRRRRAPRVRRDQPALWLHIYHVGSAASTGQHRVTLRWIEGPHKRIRQKRLEVHRAAGQFELMANRLIDRD